MAQPDDSAYHNPRRVHVSGFLIFLGAVFVLGAGVAAALSGFGSQWGWWRFQTGFGILQYAVGAGGLGALAALSGLIGALLQRQGGLALRGAAVMLAGLGVVALPLSHLQQATSVPAIHDITTDTDDPPQFRAVAEARDAAMNTVAYPGNETAAKQEKAYPWIAPLTVDRTPDAVFRAARELVAARGWTLQAADPAAGRIEATATTFWYGFKDDVVVRVRPAGDGRTRVDVRSASRVGISDLGVNAERVRAFLNDLDERLAG